MRRFLNIVAAGALCVVALLVVNMLARPSTESLLEAGYAACGEHGLARNDLLLQKYSYTEGPFSFGAKASAFFQVKDAKPPRLVRVDLRRPFNFVAWKVAAYDEDEREGPP
jgi:hypothetical protein